jgi:hypothetical protein
LKNHENAHNAKLSVIESRDNRIKALEVQLKESIEAKDKFKFDLDKHNLTIA